MYAFYDGASMQQTAMQSYAGVLRAFAMALDWNVVFTYRSIVTHMHTVQSVLTVSANLWCTVSLKDTS